MVAFLVKHGFRLDEIYGMTGEQIQLFFSACVSNDAADIENMAMSIGMMFSTDEGRGEIRRQLRSMRTGPKQQLVKHFQRPPRKTRNTT